MTKLLLKLFVKDYKNTEDPKVRGAYGKLAGIVGIICNFLLFGGKLAVGILSGAVSVTADAINNLTDASSSLVTLLGFHMAERPADNRHPYGHARMEYLSGLAVSALILVIGVELAKSSFEKIIHPVAVEFSWIVIIVLGASILVKLWMSLFCGSLGKRISSTALTATAADSRNDVISTAAVMLGLLAGHFFEWKIDGYVGMAVALFIIWSGCSLAKETISPLLGEQADPELVKSIQKLVLSHDKILGIHDLMVHDYGPGQRFASVHAEMSAGEDPLACHDVLDDVERDAYEELHVHLVVHYDPVVTDDAELNRLRKLVQDTVEQFDARLSIHDFRMVKGPTHSNLIFDVAVPFDLKDQREEIQNTINRMLAKEPQKYYTVITFDSVASNML